MVINTDPTDHSIKENLTKFNNMNKNLPLQSKKPDGLVISNQLKYDVKQDI